MNNKKNLLILALMAGILAGCATRNDELESQLLQHDAQIRQMQPVQADAWNQVQSLREEVQELRGQLADLRRIGGSSVLVDKLNRHDEALRQIETSMALKFDLGDPIVPQANPTPAAQPQADASAAASPVITPNFGATSPSLTQSSSGAYGGIGGAVTSTTQASAAPAATTATTPSAGTWGQETPRPRQQTANQDISEALYEAGVNAFNSKNYADAQRSFSDYLQNYGTGPKAAQAQYYLGECYFQTNQFADAALAYDTVINQYPDSSRAPGAYLKQGICFSKLKQNKAARARMNELIKKYPQSAEAARAKNFLKTNS